MKNIILLQLSAAFLILLSKVLLSILLALGPIFIILLLFSSTQRIFESWFAQVINYGIMVIVAVVLINLMTSIFSSYLDMALAYPEVSMVPTAYIGASGLISLLILRQVPQIAMALGGGISVASQGLFGAMARKIFPPGSSRQTLKGADRTTRLAGQGLKGTYNLARRRFGGNSITRK
jgi:type IV secretion system protein VirB6